MDADPAAVVELLARLDAVALDHGRDEVRRVVSKRCSALFGGEPLTKAERWTLALACMSELGGPLAALSPLLDERESEWSEALVEAAHATIEEVLNG